jgi:hypothetical protein
MEDEYKKETSSTKIKCDSENEESLNDVEHKIDFDEKGNIIFKKKENVKRGFKSKSLGSQFELRVRHDLEEKGWIVDKWSNNLDLEKGKIIPSKKKMAFINRPSAPFLKIATAGTGFPDFIAFQLMDSPNYSIIGVEVKMNGKLSKIEKEKCRWYLKNNIFNKILIAKKIKEKNRIKIIYDVFKFL